MNLYHVQDCDRPLFIVARDWQHALELWQHTISEENPGDYDDAPPQPSGINLVAEENDMFLGGVRSEGEKVIQAAFTRTCHVCSFDEAEGGLIDHCDVCCRRIACAVGDVIRHGTLSKVESK